MIGVQTCALPISYRKALATSTAFQMMRDDARGGWCREELLETFIALHGVREIARAGIAV